MALIEDIKPVRRKPSPKPVAKSGLKPSLPPNEIEKIAFRVGRRPVWFSMVSIITVVIGCSVFDVRAGQIVLAVYALVAIFFKIRLHYSLGLLGLFIVTLVVASNTNLPVTSEKFALYTYEAITIVTLQAIIITWLEQRSSNHGQ